MAKETDWLAILQAGSGAGSWARSTDRDKAVADVKRIFRADWKTLFQKPKGELTVVVWDVAGHKNIWWDHPSLIKESVNYTTEDGKGIGNKDIDIDVSRRSFEKITYDRW